MTATRDERSLALAEKIKLLIEAQTRGAEEMNAAYAKTSSIYIAIAAVVGWRFGYGILAAGIAFVATDAWRRRNIRRYTDELFNIISMASSVLVVDIDTAERIVRDWAVKRAAQLTEPGGR